MRTELLVWGLAALALIAAEMVVPGAFLMWLGFAAATVFALLVVIPGMPLIAQAVAFVVLSFAFIWVYRRYFRGRGMVSAEPALNRRAQQLVGQVLLLTEPLIDGVGRTQVADAFWTVRGPVLPAGARVRVMATDGMVLDVEPA